jgi:hypothetical protein
MGATGLLWIATEVVNLLVQRPDRYVTDIRSWWRVISAIAGLQTGLGMGLMALWLVALMLLATSLPTARSRRLVVGAQVAVWTQLVARFIVESFSSLRGHPQWGTVMRIVAESAAGVGLILAAAAIFGDRPGRWRHARWAIVAMGGLSVAQMGVGIAASIWVSVTPESAGLARAKVAADVLGLLTFAALAFIESRRLARESQGELSSASLVAVFGDSASDSAGDSARARPVDGLALRALGCLFIVRIPVEASHVLYGRLVNTAAWMTLAVSGTLVFDILMAVVMTTLLVIYARLPTRLRAGGVIKVAIGALALSLVVELEAASSALRTIAAARFEGGDLSFAPAIDLSCVVLVLTVIFIGATVYSLSATARALALPALVSRARRVTVFSVAAGGLVLVLRLAVGSPPEQMLTAFPVLTLAIVAMTWLALVELVRLLFGVASALDVTAAPAAPAASA